MRWPWLAVLSQRCTIIMPLSDFRLNVGRQFHILLRVDLRRISLRVTQYNLRTVQTKRPPDSCGVKVSKLVRLPRLDSVPSADALNELAKRVFVERVAGHIGGS